MSNEEWTARSCRTVVVSACQRCYHSGRDRAWADHLEPASMSFVRDGDLRYVDQGYELKIAFPAGAIGKTHSLRISGPTSTRLTNANTAINFAGPF